MPDLVVTDLTMEYSSGGYVLRPLNQLSLTAPDGQMVVLLGRAGVAGPPCCPVWPGC